MKGLGYLIGELGSGSPDPDSEIKKEIAAYTRNPKKFMGWWKDEVRV